MRVQLHDEKIKWYFHMSRKPKSFLFEVNSRVDHYLIVVLELCSQNHDINIAY